MNLPISIITPSYNQSAFLEQAIDSVLSQHYPALQYIIIDGGSNDGSQHIIKKYERHLAYWVSEKDRGQTHAINKGLKQATGHVINWLNSDDYLQPEALKIIAEHFANPSLNVLIGRSNIVQEGKIVRVSKGTDVYPGNLPKTLGQARIDQPETWFRKSVFDSLGPLDEALHYVMDKQLWIRYLLKYGLENVESINNILANFRLHDQSKTQSQKLKFVAETNLLYYQLSLQHQLNEEATFIQRHFNIFLSHSSIPQQTFNKNTIQQAVHYFLLYKADELYYLGELDKTRSILGFIQPGFLNAADIPLLNKLKFRSTYIPDWVMRMLRR